MTTSTQPNPRAVRTQLRIVAQDDDAILLRIASLVTCFKVRHLTLDIASDGWVRIQLEVASPGGLPGSTLLARRLRRVVGVVEVTQLDPE